MREMREYKHGMFPFTWDTWYDGIDPGEELFTRVTFTQQFGKIKKGFYEEIHIFYYEGRFEVKDKNGNLIKQYFTIIPTMGK